MRIYLWNYLKGQKKGFATIACLMLTLACGGKDKKDDETAAAGTTAGGTNQVTGSLNLSTALNLTANDSIIKATYAKYETDSGTMSATGVYELDVKPYPFSLTVFQNDAPVCSFRFQLGGNSSGSLNITSNLDMGSLTCEDGEAIVPEETIAAATAADFQDAVKNGTVDAALLAKLTDVKGLGMMMLTAFDEHQGHQGGGGPGPGDQGPGPEGPGPEGPGPGGPGPGGPGQEFRPIEPAQCAAAGYAVSDHAYRQFEQDYSDDYNEEEDKEQDTVVYFKPSVTTEGRYDFIIEEIDDNGDKSLDVMPAAKLGGFGNEFALVGQFNRDVNELKAEVAEREIREQIMRLDTGNEPPPPPQWSDPWCDPLNIANEVRAEMGYDAYGDIATVFTGNMGGGGFQGQRPKNPNVKGLCSTVAGSSSDLLTVDSFCYDTAADGSKTLKTTLTSNAALAFCWAAKDGAGMDFNRAPVKTLAGVESKSCVVDYEDQFGAYYKKTSTTPEATCAAWADSATIIAREGLPATTSRAGSYWGNIEFDMRRACSQLRLEGSSLQVCYNMIDKSLEPTRQEDWDTVPGVWDVKLAEADAEIDNQKATRGGFSQLQESRIRIDQCVSTFDRTVKELDKRKADIAALKNAIGIVSTAKNADGSSRYVKETADSEYGAGSFSFKAAEMAKLDAVLKKSEAALNGWLGSINTIKSTYATLKSALVKADAGDNSCLPDGLVEAPFKLLYTQYDNAFNGKTGDKTKKGVDGWQKAAFNHFQCMNYDSNIRKIKEFGLSAPTQGQEGSNAAASASVDDLFLDSECTGFYDHTGRCVKVVACKVPAGAATYITFDDLLDLATIDEGCEEIPEKIAMTGRILEREEEVPNPWGGSTVVPEGTLRAKVLIMSKLPKPTCKVNLKFPALDANSCFDYKNSAGVSWGSLTDELRKSATPSDYKLQYTSQSTSMKELSSRQIVEIALFPNSEIVRAADQGAADDTLESLIE